MYNEEIENLIKIALYDGEISEKEKQVLFRKAEAEGIDLDEFEMVLEGRLFEKQQISKNTETPVSEAPKSEKFGDVKKCPACKATIQAFQTKCSDCGHEFSNIGANVSIGKLFEMLNDCENERRDTSTSVGTAIGGFFAKLGGDEKVIEKKKSIISGFPIPNTKDDILEFLSTAVPNAKKRGNFFTEDEPKNKSHNDMTTTWKSKCEQIIMKAKFSMKDDKKTLEEIMSYAKELGLK